jgi:acyl-CoA-dependent ceramide synthase
MFRYLSLSTLCDATFVFFLISWLFSRQLGLFLVIRTSYLDAPRFIPFKWDPSRGRFLTKTTYYVWIGMQCFLLCLATVWFYMACMVAARVVRGLGAEDSRSDDEEEVASPLEEVPTMGSSSKHITPDAMTTGYGKGCEKGEVRQRWSVR